MEYKIKHEGAPDGEEKKRLVGMSFLLFDATVVSYLGREDTTDCEMKRGNINNSWNVGWKNLQWEQKEFLNEHH